jgi:hypothetical protein
LHELAPGLVEESEQPGELNVPPAPPSLQETVPVGEEGDEPVSVTEAVKVIAVPAVTEDGFGETPVVVGCGGRGWTVTEEVPVLPAWEESPG